MKYLFTIAGVIQEIDHQLYCYDTSFRTYQDALKFDDTTMRLTVIVESRYDDSIKYLFVDMNKLLSKYLVVNEFVHFNVTCWEQLLEFLEDLYDYDNGLTFNTYLKESPVPRYMHYKVDGEERTRITPFSSNMSDSIKIVSLGYTNDIIGSYVNKEFPDIRNLPHRRINMPDLVFTKKDTLDMDFRNTIPSVDGVVCYPVYNEETEELFACNGARMLKNTNKDAGMNILLMDFSKIGKLTTYKLSECRPEMIIQNGTDIWVYDDPTKFTTQTVASDTTYWQQSQFTLKFKLPEGAVAGEPLLSLAGRLFMKGLDDISCYTDGDGRAVVEFRIASGILENIVASNLQHQNLFYKQSTFFRVIMSYVFGNIFVDQAYHHDVGSDDWIAFQFHLDQIIPFISIIHANEGIQYGLDKVDPLALMSPGQILFPPHARGLLLNTKTREFVDYVRIPYQHQTVVTSITQPPLHISRREGGGTNNEPTVGTAASYADVTEYAPEDLEIEYNPILSAYVMTSASENLIWARSVNNIFELLSGSARMYSWSQITEGLTELERVPSYNPNKHVWLLKRDGRTFAVSEIDSMDYTTFAWYPSESLTVSGDRFSNMLEAIRPTLIQTVEDGDRWAIVNRANQVLAATKEKTSDNPALETWYKTGSETSTAYAALQTACREEEESQLRKEFDQENLVWKLVDNETGEVYAESATVRVVDDTDISRYTNFQWKKLLPTDDANIRWNRVLDGISIVTDNVRMDRMGWEESPKTFHSPYYETPIGELIRDTREYILVDINVTKKDHDENFLPEPDPEILPDPPKMSLTYTKIPFTDPINLGVGTAPALTGIRVEPLILNGQMSTETIVVKNAASFGSLYTKFDGNYRLTSTGAVGTARVWRHVSNTNLYISWKAATSTSSARWVIRQNNTIYFTTDKATKGTSPYNSALTWRVTNA